MEQQLKKQFTTYYCQQHAFDYQKNNPHARVFSFETPELGGGRRHFICEHPLSFYWFYRGFPHGRWFYELIQEGYPCRPYFDLEYYRKFNPNIDPIACFQDFLSICKDVFYETLDIKLSDSDFMVLDSTTKDKFSSHVIVHLPNNQLFPSNIALKPLVAMVCDRIQKLKKCIVMKENDQEDLLCDRAVYTKNRNFRLYFSSKCDKNTKLLYADYCKFYDQKPSSSTLFFDTLVVPRDFRTCPILDIEPLITKYRELFNLPNHSNFIGYSGFGMARDQQLLSESFGPSPFPELEEFFLNYMRPLCPKIKVRKWGLKQDELTGAQRIDYEFDNCRFCWNKKREHKSQNIYFSYYIKSYLCYQKCFDHECRGFSHFILVPYLIAEATKKKGESLPIKN